MHLRERGMSAAQKADADRLAAIFLRLHVEDQMALFRFSERLSQDTLTVEPLDDECVILGIWRRLTPQARGSLTDAMVSLLTQRPSLERKPLARPQLPPNVIPFPTLHGHA